MIATVAEKGLSIIACDGVQGSGDRLAQRLLSARLSPSPGTLEFGKRLLDRREIRRIAGQEPQLTLTLTNQLCHSCAFVCAQIVHDHHLPLSQARHQYLLDVHFHRQAVGSAFQKHRRPHPIQCQRGNQGGVGRGVSWHSTIGALPAWRTSIERRQVEITAAFVKYHEVVRAALPNLLTEGFACSFIAFAGTESLFLRVQPRRVIARSMVLGLT